MMIILASEDRRHHYHHDVKDIKILKEERSDGVIRLNTSFQVKYW